MTMIERWAVRYLERRGRVVLPFPFIGFAIGYATAVKHSGTPSYDLWEITVPKGSKFIALNNSIVTTAETHETPVR